LKKVIQLNGGKIEGEASVKIDYQDNITIRFYWKFVIRGEKSKF